LANFQSLTKLITLIINRFYSHCRGDLPIALTKPNFSDRLFFYPLIQNFSPYPPIQNSEFKIQNSKFFSAEPSPKDRRRMSEGKSASWRSRVCDEG